MSPACPNCATPAGAGEYCSVCGQLNRNPRFHALELVSQAFDQVIEWRAPWLRTITDLCWRPGAVALDVVEGRRARYVNPVKYCFIIVALAYAVALVAGSSGAHEASGKAAVVMDLPANVMALVAIPLEVLLLRLVFYRHERNATEIAVLCLFLTGHAVLLFQLAMTGIDGAWRVSRSEVVLFVTFSVVIVAMYGYIAYGIKQFFRAPAWQAMAGAAVTGVGTASMNRVVSDFLRFG